MDKDRLLRHPLTLIFAFFLLLFIYSKFGPTIPFSVFSQDRGAPLVVEGTGEVTVVPDIASISVGIEESGATMEAVQKSANEKSKKLVGELKRQGIDEKDIKTTNYSVFPNVFGHDFKVGKIRERKVGRHVDDYDEHGRLILINTYASVILLCGSYGTNLKHPRLTRIEIPGRPANLRDLHKRLLVDKQLLSVAQSIDNTSPNG